MKKELKERFERLSFLIIISSFSSKEPSECQRWVNFSSVSHANTCSRKVSQQLLSNSGWNSIPFLIWMNTNPIKYCCSPLGSPTWILVSFSAWESAARHHPIIWWIKMGMRRSIPLWFFFIQTLAAISAARHRSVMWWIGGGILESVWNTLEHHTLLVSNRGFDNGTGSV